MFFVWRSFQLVEHHAVIVNDIFSLFEEHIQKIWFQNVKLTFNWWFEFQLTDQNSSISRDCNPFNVCKTKGTGHGLFFCK